MDEIEDAMEDHPRTRGEKIEHLADVSVKPGSPPHTRGKV